MENLINNKIYWFLLLITVIGEFLIPYILKHFYDGYNSTMQVMSALGSPQSPVRFFYNLWLIWLGVFLIITAVIFFLSLRSDFPVLSVLIFLSVILFAIGAGLISEIFSVNESKDIASVASLIHGICASIGFMALLFFSLLNGIISFKQKDIIQGITSIGSFILSLIFFIFFIMGDKEQFQNTFLKYEGLWERFTLFFMYIPFVYKSIGHLLF